MEIGLAGLQGALARRGGAAPPRCLVAVKGLGENRPNTSYLTDGGNPE